MRAWIAFLVLSCGGAPPPKLPDVTLPPLPPATPAPAVVATPLRYDVLYAATEEDITYWLRFYDDGTVLSASTMATATTQDVDRWLKKDGSDSTGIGHYVLNGDAMRFSERSSAGVIDYEGAIEGTTLRLRWHSHINGASGEHAYEPAE